MGVFKMECSIKAKYWLWRGQSASAEPAGYCALAFHNLSAGVAFGALEGSSKGLDLCEDMELNLGKILAYDCL